MLGEVENKRSLFFVVSTIKIYIKCGVIIVIRHNTFTFSGLIFVSLGKVAALPVLPFFISSSSIPPLFLLSIFLPRCCTFQIRLTGLQ